MDVCVLLARNECTLPSPIDSRWTPHIPHGNMDSTWSPGGIPKQKQNCIMPPGIHGLHLESIESTMESTWILWIPGGVQMESMDSRWSPAGIPTEFIFNI